MYYASSFNLTAANSILNYHALFSPLYSLSFSWCPLSLCFTLSHPVSVNLIHPHSYSDFLPSLAGLPPSCPPFPYVPLPITPFPPWNTELHRALAVCRAELLSGLHLQRGCKHLARRIPLISSPLPARSSRGTFQSARQILHIPSPSSNSFFPTQHTHPSPFFRTSGAPQGIPLNPFPPVCQPSPLLRHSSNNFYTFDDGSWLLFSAKAA